MTVAFLAMKTFLPSAGFFAEKSAKLPCQFVHAGNLPADLLDMKNKKTDYGGGLPLDSSSARLAAKNF